MSFCRDSEQRIPLPQGEGRSESAHVDRTLRGRRGLAARAYYTTRRGLTLVELLVVITILTLVTAATVPLMAPVTGQRKVRETARLLSSMLAQAQSRALATGRPVGVWIERLSNINNDDRGNQSIDLSLCEVPAPYSGSSTAATASVSGNTVNIQRETIPQGVCFAGDQIRFNYRGPTYTILEPPAAPTGQSTYQDGSLTGRSMIINAPAPNLNGVPFQIYRQPMKSSDEPVALPVGAMVDLTYSGIGSGFECSVPSPSNPLDRVDPATNESPVQGAPNKPVLVVFGPSGNLDSVYYAIREKRGGNKTLVVAAKPITPMYLLVGSSPGDTVNPLFNNLNNQDNVWVAINPQSGLVTTSEVAIGREYWDRYGVTNPQLYDYIGHPNDPNRTKPAAIRDSRAFARTAQNMGGR